ncbi:MAG: translation initiation factor IF-2 [Clostridiales bacterium]|nr:translation initiation factor IF-2 [Clostridiales bacterium]
MSRNELLDSAKQLGSRTEELLERVKQLHSEVSASLQQAKRQESKLIEEEKAAAKAKAEREREERRKEFLESGEQRGVYVSAPDDETAPKEPAKQPDEPEKKPEEPKPEQISQETAPEAKPEEPKPAKQPDQPRIIDTKPAGRQGDKPADGRQRAPRADKPADRQTGRQGDKQGDKPFGDKPRTGDRKPGEKQGQKRQGGAAAPVVIPQNNRQSEKKGQYVRTFDNDKKQPKNKKTMMKEAAPSASGWDDENGFGNRRKPKKQQAQPQHKPEPVKIEKAILTSEQVTVRELSEKIGKPAAEIIKKLFMMGNIATINNEIDFETCELIAADYDIELELQLPKTAEEALAEAAGEADNEENLVERPPVVTIMGHVDHGKTSLLDAIRNSSVTAGEAGGITQHIGAYTVTCNGKKITFIDTPGHEAFTAMRARGAQVTDVVILVVAGDDGIMPQTVEAINHSKAAGVPIIVAINKMDKPEANPDRVLQQLTEHGLLCEDWGGETICVKVSAKTHMGLNTLLEMVLLQAEVLELRANPDRKAKGTIIESQLDKGRGPVATVLVQNGTLRVGDPIVAGVAFGKVRAMMDDKGRRVKEAGPSTAVEVLGFNEVPSAGDEMIVADLDKLSKLVAEERRNKIKAEQMKKLSKVSLEDLYAHISEGEVKDLNIVIKADVDGSVEAVKQALEKLSNDEVRVKCIHGAVGAITASDVMFASASNAIVIGFNVRPDSGAKALSDQEKVDIRTYRVIYQAIEDVENAMKGMFKPVYQEVVIGTISVRNTFKVSGVGTIAGAYVSDGKVQRNAQVRVVRDGIVIHEGKIASLRRFKDDVKEVAQGYECGIGIENFNDIREGDVIEAFIMEEVKR